MNEDTSVNEEKNYDHTITTEQKLEIRKRKNGNLVKMRAKLENQRPKFIRQESWRYRRLKTGWRKPKGIDSKMRIQRKGWPKLIKVGYGSPKQTRNLHPSGFKEISVFRVEDLEKINSAIHAARIAGSVGFRKKIQIMEKARELKIHILNPEREEEY